MSRDVLLDYPCNGIAASSVPLRTTCKIREALIIDMCNYDRDLTSYMYTYNSAHTYLWTANLGVF